MNDSSKNKSTHRRNLKFDKLKCGSLNVCGLKRRIQYSEFIGLVQQYDIFCVSETKLTILIL